MAGCPKEHGILTEYLVSREEQSCRYSILLNITRCSNSAEMHWLKNFQCWGFVFQNSALHDHLGYLQTAEIRHRSTAYRNPFVFVCFESPSPSTCHFSFDIIQTRNKTAKFEILNAVLLKILVFFLVTC